MSSSGKLFYGWYIVGVAFFGHFMATGAAFYIFNALMIPLCEAHSWSRTEINVAPGIGFFVGILGTLACGTLIGRVGVKRLMTFGAVLAAVSFASLGFVRNIWLFYLAFVFLSLGGAGISGVVANTMVSNWFERKRGKALGLANSGISLSGVLLPPLATLILGRVGMENAFLLVGSLILALAPTAWLVVKEDPQEAGTFPDGLKNGQDSETLGHPDGSSVLSKPRSGGEYAWTLHGLVRVGAFWKVGAAYGLMVMCIGSIMFQLAPRFIQSGFEQGRAMMMLAVTALLGALGKFVWGMLCDRFEPRRVAALLMAMTGLGVFFGLRSGSLPGMILFITCFGFSMGGIMSTLPIVTADLFGRLSFSSVYKYLSVFLALEAFGFLFMGLSFDLTGSYDPALMGYVFTSLLASGLVFTVRRPRFPCSS